MSVATVSAPPQIPPYPIWKFSVTDYHRLIDIGVLDENDRVELLEGWLVPKMSHGPLHDISVELTNERIRQALPSGWRLRVQSAITTGDSEPEPDLAIIRGDIRTAPRRHPLPTEIGLLIEVADTTLQSDRLRKSEIYGRAGILNYWIINLQDRQVECYSQPTGPIPTPGYSQCEIKQPGQRLSLELDGVVLATLDPAEFLP